MSRDTFEIGAYSFRNEQNWHNDDGHNRSFCRFDVNDNCRHSRDRNGAIAFNYLNLSPIVTSHQNYFLTMTAFAKTFSISSFLVKFDFFLCFEFISIEIDQGIVSICRCSPKRKIILISHYSELRHCTFHCLLIRTFVGFSFNFFAFHDEFKPDLSI